MDSLPSRHQRKVVFGEESFEEEPVSTVAERLA